MNGIMKIYRVERGTNLEKKLIALDLDGTTLNNQSKITTRTEAVLRELRKQGHIVSIATGRPFRNSKNYYYQLKMDTPIVNFNGALCHHPVQNDWQKEYHKTLDRNIALDLTEFKNEEGVLMIAAETKDTVYVTDSYVPYGDYYPNGHKDTRVLNAKNLKENPTSVSVFTSSNEIQPIIQQKLVDKYGDDIEVRSWGGFAPCLEVVAAGVQKAMGVEQISHYYGIDRKNILAFGDEDNDYEMIQYAGHGVAMRNGIDALKNIADDQTFKTNDQEGLAHYLENYFQLTL